MPITYGDGTGSRANKLCKCSVCGVEEICNAYFDFYTRSKDGAFGPLYCYSCLLKDAVQSEAGYVSAVAPTTLPN